MKILLVDDHAVVRSGLRRVLGDEIPGTEFGEAATAQEAIDLTTRESWTLVILDLSLPGRSGLEALKQITSANSKLPVLVMTMHAEEQYAVRAFRSGASGYITKDCAIAELVGAVQRLASGAKYITPTVAERLAGSLATNEDALHEQLSDREFQVLRMLALGQTVTEIGAALHLSEKTISTYRTRILAKLKLTKTAELVRYAICAGLTD